MGSLSKEKTIILESIATRRENLEKLFEEVTEWVKNSEYLREVNKEERFLDHELLRRFQISNQTLPQIRIPIDDEEKNLKSIGFFVNAIYFVGAINVVNFNLQFKNRPSMNYFLALYSNEDDWRIAMHLQRKATKKFDEEAFFEVLSEWS